MSSAQVRESIIRLIMNHVVDGEPSTPEELADAILSALEPGEANPVAWRYFVPNAGVWCFADSKEEIEELLKEFPNYQVEPLAPITPPSPAVTDEMRELVERAQQSMPLTYVNWHDTAKKVLSANPVPTPDGAVEALHWIDVDAVCAWTYAKTSKGEYRVTWSWNESGQRLSYPDGRSVLYPNRQSAKAAAEADFSAALSAAAATNPDQLANSGKILSKTRKDFSGAEEQIVAEVALTPTTVEAPLRKLRRILTNSELHETTRVVDAIDAIDAVLSAALSHPADGWRLVPVKPTEEMKVAGCREDDILGELVDWQGGNTTTREAVVRVYQAMLATAPAAPAAPAGWQGSDTSALIQELRVGPKVRDLEDGSNGWEIDAEATGELMRKAADALATFARGKE